MIKIHSFFKSAFATLAVASSLLTAMPAQATAQVRIRDLASVQGVRSNPLYGYGIVVGLDGTGDQTTQTPFTTQSIISMLQQSGVNLPPGTNMQLKNVASVMVTANLPAFAQPGQTVDVTVASLGNAKSLRGGLLLMTPLKGADGRVYALAQGQLVVGGAGASASGSKTQINHLSAGRIPNGAQIEQAVASPFNLGDTLTLELNSTDFSNATRMVAAINKTFGDGTAQALDGRTVRVRAPQSPDDRVAFLSRVQDLSISESIATAKVIINARTGSVVMNQAVALEPCAVAHGNLTVKISTTPVVSQPAPFSQGQTVVTQQSNIEVSQAGGQLIEMKGGAQLSDVVKALNALGATPADLISILQAMQQAGSLKAELEVI
ncbi:MAG TPA: flagellar basal body P-ring protein FlgI [Limnobacter sp.]|uniref:flagellar basal body P-ring protein FlgI n=1 Tax=Limnobacter sp. TaxID=2003368 RepID=UPI002E380D88|nr:flagellar basal body P-ring protein FlgI [Limnobacter sp.]HEX5484395.1 flagellar basal body P-ring protein FlgI [Limnobacter sp.]